MSAPEPIPALDRLGIDLGRALRTPRARRPWPLRPTVLAAVAAALVVVPAAATQVQWAEPHGGETALPGAAPSALRLTVAHRPATARHGGWRFVLYRARLGSRAPARGPVGLCAYVTVTDGGSGQCAAGASPVLLSATGSGDGLGVLAGVVPSRVVRIELTLAAGRHRVVVPRPVDGRELAARGMPSALATYAVPSSAPLLGAVAYDARGAVVARTGRPTPIPVPEHP